MRKTGNFRLYQKPKLQPLTEEGLGLLKDRVAKLKSERPDAVMNLKKAREMGDLSENGYYKASRQRLSSIDSEIRRTDFLIKNALVIKKPSNGRVGLGSTVTLGTGSKKIVYTLTGKTEANPSKGRISNMSPLGKSLIGKEKGDKVAVTTPGGMTEYLILNIK